MNSTWYILNTICINCIFTPSPPTKSFDFRGFDSSRLLILRVGNSHVRIMFQGVSRKVLIQGLLIGKLLVGGPGVLYSTFCKGGCSGNRV